MKKILLLLAAITLLTGCWEADINRVNLRLGDSIIMGSTEQWYWAELRQHNADLTINNAIGGMTLSLPKALKYWIERIEAIDARLPIENIFIGLGTNDAVIDPADQAPGAMEAAVHELMASIRSDIQVYWTLPHAVVQPRHWETKAAIELAATAWPNLKVLDFELWVSQNTDENFSDLLLGDAIHFNNRGSHLLAQMQLEQLQ
jgi:hypothetical protein